MQDNYAVTETGFLVQDSETHHIFEVKYENGMYHGRVMMLEQNENIPLAPWKRGENPFQDDNKIEGMQTGYAPNGYWWFSIRPSVPFSQIMAEFEAPKEMKLWQFWRKGNKSKTSFLPEKVQGQICAHSICLAVNDLDVIYQLVLEDIEGASMGNEEAKAFANNSGIQPHEYRGALNNSRPEVDGPKGGKTFLDSVALKILKDNGNAVAFRLAATDYIMRFHGLGKYAS